ncbi:hypothetical protein HMPREF1548_02827 [Clostridium sp. KLE 1755]|nr:hypothetical protein HMPREF1548_02827 [Clostridium sp. KLE 1755]
MHLQPFLPCSVISNCLNCIYHIMLYIPVLVLFSLKSCLF